MYPFAESEKWVQKAKDCYEDADILIDYGKKHGPVSKIYYSAFSCAKALLTLHKIKALKHSSVMSLFGKVLVKEKGLDKKFGRFLNETFNKRKNADYATSPKEFSRKELKGLLRTSSEFIQTTQDYIDGMNLSNESESVAEVPKVKTLVIVSV
ncbi:MAG: HEPN domain-containing protein [Candidatus Omnitrophica bacterium]|nr:HEPN domain-containing protein [Candidatus Omnitrophota bacterium]